MAEAGGAGFDPSMLSSLLALVAGNRGGPSGLSNYVPSHAVPGFGPYQGGSMSSMLSMLGPLGASAGAAGDIFGMAKFPDMMARLQNPGADPLTLQRQQMMMREMSRFQYANGQQIASGIGLTPGSMPYNVVAGASPLLMAMSPEFQQIASAITPNVLSPMGAQRMMSASMIADPMSRFQPAAVQALDDARKRLTMTGKGFTDTRFTAGFSQDEFQGFVEYAADQGMEDIGFDRKKRRRELRDEMVESRFKGKKYDDLASDDQKSIMGEAQRGVEAESLQRGGKFAATIGRAVMQTFGVGAGEARGIMQQLNVGASSAGETAGYTKLIQNLDALSKASGMTAQNMINAARAIQAQSGGDLLFHSAVAQEAQLASRFMQRDASAKGMDVNDSMAAVSSGRIATTGAAIAQAGYARSIAAMRMVANESENAQLDEALKAASNGDASKLNRLSNDVTRGRGKFGQKAHGVQIGDDQLAASQRAEMVRGGEKGYNFEKSLFQEIANDAAMAAIPEFADFNRRSKEQQIAALQFTGGTGTLEDALKAGWSEDAIVKYRKRVQLSGASGSRGQMFDAAQRRLVFGTAMEGSVEEQRARQQAANELQDALRAEGAGQGLIPNIRANGIKSIGDVLQSIGYAKPEDLDKLVKGFSEKDQAAFIQAGKDRADANELLAKDPKDPTAQRKLSEAVNTLATLGVTEREKEATDKAAPAGDSPNAVPAGKNVPIEDVPVDTHDKAAPAGDSPNAAPPGKTSSHKTADKVSDRDQMARLDINLTLDGKPIKNTEFTSKVSARKGYREITLNGSRQS